MKIINNTQCCNKVSNNPDIGNASEKSNGMRRYILYAIPVLVIWWLIYQRLSDFSRAVTYRVLNMPEGIHLSSAVEFFLFETPKVLMLLILVVFGVGVIRSFFTPEKTRKILAGKCTDIFFGAKDSAREWVLFIFTG